MTFARLRAAEWVVLVAALALLLTTAADWYSTTSGEEARRIEQQARPEDDDQPSGQIEREVEEDAGVIAEGEERNAWQESGLVDRIILIALLGTTALGVFAAFWRASGRRSEGLGPFAAAGLAACVTALLVVYRVLQEPGFDESTTIQIGAPLALAVLGVLAFACATALRTEPAAADLESPG